MTPRNYWLDLFTGTTWEEFLNAGAEVSGFRQTRWKTVQQIKAGDCLLCYLTGVSRFVAALEVVGHPFRDQTPIWKDEDFPCRLPVKVLVRVTPETAIPITELRDQLTIFQNMKTNFSWSGHLRGSPAKWKPS